MCGQAGDGSEPDGGTGLDEEEESGFIFSQEIPIVLLFIVP